MDDSKIALLPIFGTLNAYSMVLEPFPSHLSVANGFNIGWNRSIEHFPVNSSAKFCLLVLTSMPVKKVLHQLSAKCGMSADTWTALIRAPDTSWNGCECTCS